MRGQTHRNNSAVVAALTVALLTGSCTPDEDAPAVSFEENGLRVDVLMPADPVREGGNEIRLRVRDAQGAPVDDARVSLQYRMDMAGMAPMGGRVSAKPMGGGEYRAEADLEMAGTWQIALNAERPSGESARAAGSLRTGAAGLQLESGATEASGDAISHYTCPMHTSVHEKHSAKCPICGMDLVPITKSEAAAMSSMKGSTSASIPAAR